MNLEVSGKHKKLTRFRCQELLYELLSGRLDADKRAQVEAFLQEDRDSQRELERLDRGLTYAQQAATVEVASELSAALEDFEPPWKRTLWKWTLWSSQRGWKYLPYAFLAAALAAGLIVTKPWQAARTEIILAEQPRTEPAAAKPMPESQVISPRKRPTPLIPDEPPPENTAQPGVSQIGESIFGPVLPLSPLAPAESSVAAKVEDPAPEPAGWVYRSTMEVGDFTQTWNAIRDKIEEMDGKAATDEELAVLRRGNEARFNFSLPESKRDDLLEYLKTFGPVRFNKVHDPRVMPDGEIRIILTVKDNGEHAEEEKPAQPEGEKPPP
jgi:hypothetical protein